MDAALLHAATIFNCQHAVSCQQWDPGPKSRPEAECYLWIVVNREQRVECTLIDFHTTRSRDWTQDWCLLYNLSVTALLLPQHNHKIAGCR